MKTNNSVHEERVGVRLEVGLKKSQEICVCYRSYHNNCTKLEFEDEENRLIRVRKAFSMLGIKQHSMLDLAGDLRRQDFLMGLVENNLCIEWPLIVIQGILLYTLDL